MSSAIWYIGCLRGCLRLPSHLATNPNHVGTTVDSGSTRCAPGSSADRAAPSFRVEATNQTLLFIRAVRILAKRSTSRSQVQPRDCRKYPHGDDYLIGVDRGSGESCHDLPETGPWRKHRSMGSFVDGRVYTIFVVCRYSSSRTIDLLVRTTLCFG
jgi:hypothetical protein